MGELIFRVDGEGIDDTGLQALRRPTRPSIA